MYSSVVLVETTDERRVDVRESSVIRVCDCARCSLGDGRRVCLAGSRLLLFPTLFPSVLRRPAGGWRHT